MHYVVMFSGGLSSFMTAVRIDAKLKPSDKASYLFADTLIEDNDLYRFIVEGSAFLHDMDVDSEEVSELANQGLQLPILLPFNNPGYAARLKARKAALAKLRLSCMQLFPKLTWICEGRTPWEVFRDVRFIGNSRVDPCSKVLKRDLCDSWIESRCDPADTLIALGLDWTETHRIDGASGRFASLGWRTCFPMNEAPFFHAKQSKAFLERTGIELPRLYKKKFSHNNCGGFCIKAGQGHFANLLAQLPDVYYQNETEEEGTRQRIGRNDVAVMKRSVNYEVLPLTMRELRQRIQGESYVPDPTDIGGCGCFSDASEND